MSDDGQGDHTQNYQSRIERIDLEEGSEWRFELEGDEDIAVRVSGMCPSGETVFLLCYDQSV